MSSRLVESPIFDTFWDTISFIINGIIFFFAGASSVNFFWRSSEVCFFWTLLGNLPESSSKSGLRSQEKFQIPSVGEFCEAQGLSPIHSHSAVILLRHMSPVPGSFLARLASLRVLVEMDHVHCVRPSTLVKDNFLSDPPRLTKALRSLLLCHQCRFEV